MAIECYHSDCRFHTINNGGEGPFCDETGCQMQICGRCFDYAREVYPANCEEKPETLIGLPLGQYHCPDCGAMVIAGVPHPTVCKPCLLKIHPRFDCIVSADPPTPKAGSAWLSTNDNKIRKFVNGVWEIQNA